MGPSNSEDPEDRKARLRERRLSLLENRRAAEKTSTGLTTDLGSVYGLQSLSMFGKPGAARRHRRQHRRRRPSRIWGGKPTWQPKTNRRKSSAPGMTRRSVGATT